MSTITDKPNVVLIYADDLGRGMLSCYGQRHFETPHIDALAAGGMRFSHAYGNHMCAPARASLLCGIHDCHAGRWSFTKAGLYVDYAKGRLPLDEVYELIHNTGIEQRAGDTYLPMLFKRAGYVTGQVGKLEWGFCTTGDELKAHGWDAHYGYYDHQMCHGFYPPFVFENGKRIDIEGNTDPDCGKGYAFDDPRYWAYKRDLSDKRVYSQDLFDAQIERFLTRHRDRPFFLYHPTQLPHLALSVPRLHDSVKDAPMLTESEREYASMVLRLDETVGRIRRTLEKLGIAERTMILFTADNGHCFYYGHERNGYGLHVSKEGRPLDHFHVRYTSEAFGDVFDGNNGMTGCKLSSFEGGVRVPLIVHWPGMVAAGSETGRMVANYDIMATMADMLGVDMGPEKDSLSYLPLLRGDASFAGHPHIVFAGEHGPALVTRDGWKLRSYLHPGFGYDVFGGTWPSVGEEVTITLHNILDDPREENDQLAARPALSRKLQKLLIRECDGTLLHGTTQPHFAFYGYDYLAEGGRECEAT